MPGAAVQACAEAAAERSLRRLIAAALLLPILVFAATAALSYGSHFTMAHDRLKHRADIVHEHALKVFETLELVGAQVDQLLAGLPDDEVQRRAHDLQAHIGAMANRLDQVYLITVLDAQGRALASSSPTPIPHGTDYSDREYFRAFRDGSAPPRQAYVTELLAGRRNRGAAFFAVVIRRGSQTLAAARQADIPFAGVIAVSASPNYFTDFYRQFALDDLDTASIVRADGSLLARYPAVPAGADPSRLPVAASFKAATEQAPEWGTYESTSLVDGARRIYAYRRLPGYPVYVIVGIDRATVLADWRNTMGRHLLFGVPATVGLVLLALTALRRTQRESRALARLAERTRELDQVWRVSRDLMVVGDMNGVLRAVNPAWGDTLGYTPEEVVGRHYRAFVHSADLQEADLEFERLARGEILRDVDIRMRAKDGSSRWFSWNCVPEEGTFHAAGRDITERRQLSEQLRQSQKMEAVGQLTGGIAHDFNNMLAIVIGSLDMLRRRLSEAETDRLRLIDNAMDGAKRAATLTQRLLAFSRQQTLAPMPLDANTLVAGMSDLLQRTLTEGIQLETQSAPGLWPIFADPNQLESAILNLAVNARDAMPEGGGRLIIETANAILDDSYVREHFGVQAGQYVLVAVTDTGVGMSPTVVRRAFEPFFSTKEVGKGTGLGLAMVYGFVKQSGGHVRIYSEPGHGTTVKLYLPRHRAATSAADGGEPAESRPLPARDSRGEMVLVVEDEPAVRRLSVEGLRELGYRVVAADGAVSALLMLERNPDIALLFTDVVMPEVNGGKLAEEARRRRPDLKVLFTTGYAGNAVVRNGVVEQGMHLLGKPFTLDQLACKIAEALDEPVKADATA